MRIGVLALQGGFASHRVALASMGHHAFEVRDAASMTEVEGLVLPGGESTTHRILLDSDAALADALHTKVESGAPVLATCAGLILAAKEGWLDVRVERNAYGRQRQSAETVADDGTPLVLIRAPRIVEVGARAEVLATLAGEPVLVREGAVVGATFHPELTDDRRVYERAFGVARGRSPALDGAMDPRVTAGA